MHARAPCSAEAVHVSRVASGRERAAAPDGGASLPKFADEGARAGAAATDPPLGAVDAPLPGCHRLGPLAQKRGSSGHAAGRGAVAGPGAGFRARVHRVHRAGLDTLRARVAWHVVLSLMPLSRHNGRGAALLGRARCGRAGDGALDPAVAEAGDRRLNVAGARKTGTCHG